MKITHEKVVIGCGIWLLILPYTGFPSSWKTVLTVLTGLVLVYVGALAFKRARMRNPASVKEKKTETFTETV